MAIESQTGISIENKRTSIPGNYSKEYRRMFLAKKIKLKLKADNIKVGTFAIKLGKNPSEISKWLSGKHNFTLDTLFEIEDVLGINLVNIDLPYKDVTNGSVELDIPIKPSGSYIINTKYTDLRIQAQKKN